MVTEVSKKQGTCAPGAQIVYKPRISQIRQKDWCWTAESETAFSVLGSSCRGTALDKCGKNEMFFFKIQGLREVQGEFEA